MRKYRRPAYWGEREERAKQRRQGRAGQAIRPEPAKVRKKRVRGWCGVGMRVAGAHELMQLDVAVAGGGWGLGGMLFLIACSFFLIIDNSAVQYSNTQVESIW